MVLCVSAKRAIGGNVFQTFYVAFAPTFTVHHFKMAANKIEGLMADIKLKF